MVSLARRFDKVLIANRGEIACRIIRTAKGMGLRTVAVYSDADRGAMHVALADEAVLIGPAPAKDSYLHIGAILEAVQATSAEAIHPGYGFLSENADFAQACADGGLVFIGPSAATIRLMGFKSAAKALMESSGVPVVPGYHGEDQSIATLQQAADRIGYPLLVKASAGGGGRGMRLVGAADEFAEAVAAAKREAASSFGNDQILIEKHIAKPRHIEVQVFADNDANVVSLFERECTLQRRHQKVVEEALSIGTTAERRAAMSAAARSAAQAAGYVGAGTVEFIADSSGFYFIEMNTRIQVEHPVTEMITDIDLVLEQIRVAAGAELLLEQKDVRFHGHAIECRINAENPVSFRPSPGRILHYHTPGGLGIRVDSAAYQGYEIPPYYDSLVGKLIVHGKTRTECLMRLKRALDEFVIDGIDTTLPLFRALVREQDIVDGDYHIHWLQDFLARAVLEE